jgi:riboflavin kinase/FMN adenylyltransferase
VTIGVFDGVHRGHQRLVLSMVAAAHTAGCVAVAYTFDPHPLAALGREPPLLLTTVEQRAEMMAALGLDLLVVPPFTLTTASTRAADFSEALVRDLRMVELWIGPDFALGHRREGDLPLLQGVGLTLGFTVRVVKPLVCEGSHVSSSRIRAALGAGDVEWASSCLGRPYRLHGVAIPGCAPVGSFPRHTIRISPQPGRLVPAPGVYACTVRTEASWTYPGIVSVGAVSGSDGRSGGPPTIEIRLLDFDGDLLGEAVAVDFVARMPDASRFSGGDERVVEGEDEAALVRRLLSAGWQAGGA